ncbi:MAG: hypothetical protein K2X87_34835 [Gemmataceae bacterium]|nr:hypothetical protein [Gemmataceae bacterium]
MGEQGKPAARALCQAIVTPGMVRAAALDALKQVHPELYPHVSTIISDPVFENQYNAIREIAKLGPDGDGAVPILYAQLMTNLATCRRLERFNEKEFNFDDTLTMTIPLIDNAATLEEILRSFDIAESDAKGVFTTAAKAAFLAAADAVAISRVAGGDKANIGAMGNAMLVHPNNFIRYAGLVSLSLAKPEATKQFHRFVKKLKTDPSKPVRELANRVDEQLETVGKDGNPFLPDKP